MLESLPPADGTRAGHAAADRITDNRSSEELREGLSFDKSGHLWMPASGRDSVPRRAVGGVSNWWCRRAVSLRVSLTQKAFMWRREERSCGC